MSLWPIILMECRKCHTKISVFDYGLDTYDDQQEFFDALTLDGWDVRGKARDIEADDDGIVSGYCPKCRVDRSRETEG